MLKSQLREIGYFVSNHIYNVMYYVKMFNRWLDKFFPRFYAYNYDKRYIVDCCETNVYQFTGTFPSIFHNVIGKRFVKDYYYAVNEIQEKLYNWSLECWKRQFGDNAYDEVRISPSPCRDRIDCEVMKWDEYKSVAITLTTNFDVNVKDKKYWKVITGIEDIQCRNSKTSSRDCQIDKDKWTEFFGEELFDVQAYLQR